MRKIAFLLSALLILTAVLAGCGGTKEEVVSYEIDPAKISAAPAVEERLESFRTLLNQKTEGFSRVFAYYNEEIKGVGYFLMIYGDYDQNMNANFEIIARQLFIYTAKYVLPDVRYIEVYTVHSGNDQFVLITEGEEIEGLKTANLENWKNFVNPPVYLMPVPMEAEQSQP